MDYYNSERTNQGRYFQDRTLYETFTDTFDLQEQNVFKNPIEIEEVMQYIIEIRTLTGRPDVSAFIVQDK